MSALSFFDKLIGLQKRRAETASGNYRQLVAAIARDDEPDPVEVERLLADIGKSVDDLRQDVDRCRRRLKLKNTVAAMPSLEAERDEIEKEIAAADKALEAAEQHHDEVTEPLYARRRDVLAALSDGSKAMSELIRTCDDEALCRQLANVEAEASGIDREYHNLREQTQGIKKQERHERQLAEQALLIPDKCEHEDRASELQKQLDSLHREAKKLEKKRADLDEQRRRIEQQMREA